MEERGEVSSPRWGRIAIVVTIIAVVVMLGVIFGPSLFSDRILPQAVQDLRVEPWDDSFFLTWTAPGDDFDTGRAEAYDVRYLESRELTEDEWDSAASVSAIPPPSNPGQTETVRVPGLDPGATYYFAVKTRDDAGNVAPISNVVTDTLVFGERWRVHMSSNEPESRLGYSTQWGPVRVELNSSEGQHLHCEVIVSGSESFSSDCASFRYSYRFRTTLEAQLDFSIQISLLANQSQASASLEVKATSHLRLDVLSGASAEYEGIVAPIDGHNFGTESSSEIGGGLTIYDEMVNLTPGTPFSATIRAADWVWVNITANVSITYTLEVDETVVVEGNCRGSTSWRFRSSQESVEFDLRIELDASSQPGLARITIEGPPS